MYILDTEKFARRLKEKGFAGIMALADTLGVHRNTIPYYLAGRPVFSNTLEKVFSTLDLEPSDIIINKPLPQAVPETIAIAPLVDRLHAAFPATSYVLFGSRASGRARRYADWDVGVFAAQGLTRAAFRKLLRAKDDWQEDSAYFVDLVNLNRVDTAFLRHAAKDWRLLAGRQQDWLALQKKAVA